MEGLTNYLRTGIILQVQHSFTSLFIGGVGDFMGTLKGLLGNLREILENSRKP